MSLARRSLLGLVGASLLASGAAFAADAEALKYRQTVMKGVGAHMGAMGQIAKGEAEHPMHLVKHARAIEGNLSMVVDAFAMKTSGGETAALDKIWSDWDEFKAKAAEAEKAANVLVHTIENKGDVAAAMKTLGSACGGCHKAFRKQKE